MPSLINDIEESQLTLGDIQEWCFLNRLMPLIQLQEGSVTEAATVWNVLHTIPGVNKINLSCVQGCVNKPRPHLAAHSTLGDSNWSLQLQKKIKSCLDALLKLRSQGQIQILTFTVQNWVVPQQNFRKTSKHVWGAELHLLFLLEAAWIQPLEILLIKPFRASLKKKKKKKLCLNDLWKSTASHYSCE